MKNTFQVPGLSIASGASLNLKKTRFVLESLLQKSLLRMSGLACLGSIFLLASCSQDALESGAISAPDGQQKHLTLVPNPDELIEIEDLVPLELKTTEAAGVDGGRFNITLKFLVPVSDRQREVFEEAAARWERIIIEDEPSFTGVIPSAFDGLPPAIDGTADDVVIEVALIPIDGPFGTLGAAGPRYVRLPNFLTLTGVMFFDTDDLDFLDSLDLFEEVIVHEMGHVLGIGTLWNVPGRTLRAGPDSDPYFTGRKANVFWNAEGGTDELPIENMGGPGTALGHWRESALNNELMTGFLNLGENPLSRITAGSMKDLGYGAASVGESYDLLRGTEGVDPTEPGGPGEPALHIAEMEELLQPIGLVSTKKN